MKYVHSSAYAIIHPFALTGGGGQGRSTIKVLEVLRHKLGLCDVEEDRKDKTTKLHTFGSFCCDVRQTGSKSSGKARDNVLGWDGSGGDRMGMRDSRARQGAGEHQDLGT